MAEEMLAQAAKQGMDSSDILILSTREFEGTCLRQAGRTYTDQVTSSRMAASIRTISLRRMGLSFCEPASRETVARALKAAVLASRATNEDIPVGEFPCKRNLPVVSGIEDPFITSATHEAISNTFRDLVDEAVCRIQSFELTFSLTFTRWFLANSNGVRYHVSETLVSLGLALPALMPGTTFVQQTAAWRAFDKREIIGQLEYFGKLPGLPVIPAPRERLPTILTPVSSRKLYHVILDLACVPQRGQGGDFLLPGTRVAARNLSLDDDGIQDGGVRTLPFDGDGSPRRKTQVVENGVVKQLLSGHFSVPQVQCTGNSVRWGVEPTNPVVYGPRVELSSYGKVVHLLVQQLSPVPGHQGVVDISAVPIIFSQGEPIGILPFLKKRVSIPEMTDDAEGVCEIQSLSPVEECLCLGGKGALCNNE